MSKIQIFVVALFLTIKKLTDQPAPTIDALMQGKLAGVAVSDRYNIICNLTMQPELYA